MDILTAERATVADLIAWEALPEETQRIARAALANEMYGEIERFKKNIVEIISQ